MAYTGKWRTARQRIDHAAPLGHPEYSQLHMRTDFVRPGSRPPYAAPRTDPGPDSIRDPGTAYDQVLTRQAPGVALDKTPEGHGGVAGPGGYIGALPGPSRRTGNRARSVDEGASLRQVWRRPKGRSADDRRDTVRLEVAPTSNGSRIGTLRGANSLPENNPEGYRVGYRIQRWMNRKIPTRWRHHDLRPLRIQLAGAAVESPAPEHGNRYTSPFAWTVKGKRRTVSAAVERRLPRPWDEDAVGDGVTEDAGETAAPLPGWGL